MQGIDIFAKHQGIRWIDQLTKLPRSATRSELPCFPGVEIVDLPAFWLC